MANHATEYIAKKLEELATSAWSLDHLPYKGLTSNESAKDRSYGFGEVQVVLTSKGDLWIQSKMYRNFVAANGYHTAQEAVSKIFEHLKYIEINHQRLQSDPEDWAPKGVFARLRDKLSA